MRHVQGCVVTARDFGALRVQMLVLSPGVDLVL